GICSPAVTQKKQIKDIMLMGVGAVSQQEAHMATGKAAVLDRPMGTFLIAEFRVPDPAPGTVLLRQELAGCCATDAHTYLGQWPADFPVILGHENVGIIEAIGPGGALDFLGREVRVGDRVIARTGCCGTCYECRVAHQPRRCRNLRVRYGFSRAQDAPLSGGFGPYSFSHLPPATLFSKIHAAAFLSPPDT